MELGDYVSRYRKDAGITIDELASLSGVPKGTINKIIAGTTKSPTLETVQSLAAALGRSINDFIDSPNKDVLSLEEKDHIRKYRFLDQYGREAVDGVLDVEWRRCMAPVKKPEDTEEQGKVIYIKDWYPRMPMSAGTGQPAEGDKPEELELRKRPPRGTSYVAPVSGNSMEPTYHDGDKLFIQDCVEIDVGQVGVFFMEGQLWVKELGDGMLISHNPAYPPRPMTDDVRCQGLVLGVCDESYFD